MATTAPPPPALSNSSAASTPSPSPSHWEAPIIFMGEDLMDHVQCKRPKEDKTIQPHRIITSSEEFASSSAETRSRLFSEIKRAVVHQTGACVFQEWDKKKQMLRIRCSHYRPPHRCNFQFALYWNDSKRYWYIKRGPGVRVHTCSRPDCGGAAAAATNLVCHPAAPTTTATTQQQHHLRQAHAILGSEAAMYPSDGATHARAQVRQKNILQRTSPSSFSTVSTPQQEIGKKLVAAELDARASAAAALGLNALPASTNADLQTLLNFQVFDEQAKSAYLNALRNTPSLAAAAAASARSAAAAGLSSSSAAAPSPPFSSINAAAAAATTSALPGTPLARDEARLAMMERDHHYSAASRMAQLIARGGLNSMSGVPSAAAAAAVAAHTSRLQQQQEEQQRLLLQQLRHQHHQQQQQARDLPMAQLLEKQLLDKMIRGSGGAAAPGGLSAVVASDNMSAAPGLPPREAVLAMLRDQQRPDVAASNLCGGGALARLDALQEHQKALMQLGQKALPPSKPAAAAAAAASSRRSPSPPQPQQVPSSISGSSCNSNKKKGGDVEEVMVANLLANWTDKKSKNKNGGGFSTLPSSVEAELNDSNSTLEHKDHSERGQEDCSKLSSSICWSVVGSSSHGQQQQEQQPQKRSATKDFGSSGKGGRPLKKRKFASSKEATPFGASAHPMASKPSGAQSGKYPSTRRADLKQAPSDVSASAATAAATAPAARHPFKLPLPAPAVSAAGGAAVETKRALEDEIRRVAQLLPNRANYAHAQRVAPGVVDKESNPVRFLRASKFDVAEAAQRLAAYWDVRKELFPGVGVGGNSGGHAAAGGGAGGTNDNGGDDFLLPLNQTGEGCLDRGAVAAVCRSAFFLLPADSKQRAVLCYDPSKLAGVPHEVVLQVAFYLFNVAAENETAQKDGIVLLCLVDQDNVEALSGGPNFVRLLNVLPLHFHAVHVICRPASASSAGGAAFPAPRSSEVASAVRASFGQDAESRLVFHQEDSREVLHDRLSKEHGISRESLPKSLGGGWGFGKIVQWQELRTRFEWGLPPGPNCKQVVRLFDYGKLRSMADLTEAERFERNRRLNVLNSRRKRERARIMKEVLLEQHADLEQHNRVLGDENKLLEELLETAKAKVAVLEQQQQSM